MPTITVSTLPGIHQNSNVTTGGGTDDTSIIQAAIDANPGGLTLIQDGASLVTGLNIGSNTTIQCSSGSNGFYLANGSNREIIRNKNRSATIITDANITLNGGTYNGNGTNQSGVNQSDNTPMNAVAFYGISNLTIENLTVKNSASWEIGIGNFSNVTVNNCSLTASAVVSNLNTDGINLRGPGSVATLSNLTITAGDDSIALNSRNYGSSIIGPFIGGGNISNVVINNITFQNISSSGSWAGIDLISNGTFSINDVYISNLSGSVQNYALYLNRDIFHAPTGAGSYSNIFLAGSNSVAQLGTPFGAGIPAGLWLIDGAVTNLQMSGFSSGSYPVTISLPTSNGTVSSFILNNQQYNPTFQTGPFNVVLAGVSLRQIVEPGTASSVSSISQQFNSTSVVLGDLLIAFSTLFLAGGATITSVTDTAGNTYVPVATFNDGATGHYGAIFVCASSIGSGAITVTAHFSTTVTAGTLEIADYKAGTNGLSVDATSTLSIAASGTTVTCPAISASKTNELIIGLGSYSGAGVITPGTGFTVRQQGSSTQLLVLEDMSVPAIGSYTPTWTQAANPSYNASMSLFGSASQGPFTISGNTGIGGASVAYTGPSSGAVTADSTGNYAISGLTNGSYVLTASLAGFLFSAPQNVTVSSTDVTGVVFSVSAPTNPFVAVIVSCAPRATANTWEVIYQYPLDAGGVGQALVVVGPYQAIQSWATASSTITIPNSPGSSQSFTFACPPIVQWATFGIGTYAVGNITNPGSKIVNRPLPFFLSFE